MYTLDDYDFELPEELIAQYPPEKRGGSRLMVLDRCGGITDTIFDSVADFLREGDLLVMNNARVVNARVFFTRESGALVECVLAAAGERPARVICNKTKKLKAGELLSSQRDPRVTLRVVGREGEYLLMEPSEILDDACLQRIGEIPLPPYIKRRPDENDAQRYQTIYAKKSGSVAAPTAGLHFNEETLCRLDEKGVLKTFVTLDVSWGTFAPVRDNDLDLHRMHEESYEISDEAASAINSARFEHRRVIAVGTTSVRVLESCYCGGRVYAGLGKTDIFIRPPAKIESIDGLLTNFHTPRSTLLMLVSSFAGYDRIMEAYKNAVVLKYRFFSYGDAMLII